MIFRCADLVGLGVEDVLDVNLIWHDHRCQSLQDEGQCHCWRNDPDGIFEYGEFFSSAEYDEQYCGFPVDIDLSNGDKISLCCKCAEQFEDLDKLAECVYELLTSMEE